MHSTAVSVVHPHQMVIQKGCLFADGETGRMKEGRENPKGTATAAVPLRHSSIDFMTFAGVPP